MMTVGEVLMNFRSALLATVPAVESVGIPWTRLDAYDEWDEIASTLYDKLVVAVLRWSLPEGAQQEFRVPSYDLFLSSYADMSTVEIKHPSLSTGRWLFHAFGTEDEPFDIIEVRPLSEEGRPLTDDSTTCPVLGAGFQLRLAKISEPSTIIEEVRILPSLR